MQIEEITALTKSYFGRNRTKLKKLLKSFKFDGSQHKSWKKQISSITSQPFNLGFQMFDDVIENLISKNYNEIDWKWLGDISWEIEILLNDGVEKGFDWDKKLALKCGGTARILKVYISDVIPCFVTDCYYMSYSKSENYYEFGPIKELTAKEKKIINTIKTYLKNKGFKYLPKKDALKKYAELYSDCNDGDARLFDSLFSDTDNYQTEIKRFNNNDIELKDYNGVMVNWSEFYDKSGNLLKREEYKYFPSKNGMCLVTNGNHEIIEIKVWKDIKGLSHCEFRFDLLKEEKKKLRKFQAQKAQTENKEIKIS